MTATTKTTCTPLPSIRWYHKDNDGEDLPVAERCWYLTFDVGDKHIDIQMFADGTCEWFASDRKTHEYGGTEDAESFDKVANDPKFSAAMQAIRDAYDAQLRAATEPEAPREQASMCGKRCDHGSECLALVGHAGGHETQHGCVFYDDLSAVSSLRKSVRVSVTGVDGETMPVVGRVETRAAPNCNCGSSEPCGVYPCDCECHVNEVSP